MADNDYSSFVVGDRDLLFLGLAVGLAARFQARRRRGRGTRPAVPKSASNAVELFALGLRAAAAFPLDDVPEIHITVRVKNDSFHKLQAMVASQEESEETG